MAKREWHEEDAFWVNFSPVMFDAKRWDAAEEEARGAARILGLKPGARVLDACCGVGRHCFELARLGMLVTGVDRTGELVEAARATAAAGGLELDFVVEDVRAFRRPGAFDAVINMGTSIGYFEALEDDRLFLERCREALKPGGRLLVDTWGKELVARDFVADEWYEQDGCLVCAAYRILGDWERLENRWIVARGTERFERRFSFRMYSGLELREELERAGFSDPVCYGSFDGGPYDIGAKRLIAVGTAT